MTADSSPEPCSACAIRSAATHAGCALFVGNHQDLARTRHFVDIHYTVDHPLGGLHVGVAGPDDLVDRHVCSRFRRRARQQRARRRRGRIHRRRQSLPPPSPRGARSRADGGRHHHDFAHAGDARRNRIHQHRGRIRAHAAGNINSHPMKRPHHLAQAHPEIVGIGKRFLDGLSCGNAAMRRAASSSARRSAFGSCASASRSSWAETRSVLGVSFTRSKLRV